RRLHVRAEAHAARVGGEAAEDEANEGGLARAVRADEADAVPAADDEVEAVDDRLFAEALGHAGELGDEPARALALGEAEPQRAGALAALGALRAQALQPAHPAF